MPGFGRGPPLPGGPLRPDVGRLPPPGRGGMLPGPVELADGLGRGVDERDGAEPPIPKGLLPTRGERGPGFGDRGRDDPGEALPSSGRGPGRCSAGRCGATRWSVAGRCGGAGVFRAAGRSTAGGRSPKAGRSGTTRCSAAAGRSGASGGCATRSVECGVPAAATSGAEAGRRAGAGPGLGVPGPAGGCAPGEPPPLPRPWADVPLAWEPIPASEGKESRSLRATGASTVEEADFTYSPRSASFLRTSLLVTPSSFASSCTRALPATALLTDGAGGNPARPRY
jgi:hypothetical protein